MSKTVTLEHWEQTAQDQGYVATPAKDVTVGKMAYIPLGGLVIESHAVNTGPWAGRQFIDYGRNGGWKLYPLDYVLWVK